MLFPCTPTECAQVVHFYSFSPLEEEIDAQLEEVRQLKEICHRFEMLIASCLIYCVKFNIRIPKRLKFRKPLLSFDSSDVD